MEKKSDYTILFCLPTLQHRRITKENSFSPKNTQILELRELDFSELSLCELSRETHCQLPLF